MAGTSHVEEGRKGSSPPDPPPALDDAITQRQWRPSPSGGWGSCALYTRREITAWPPAPLRTSQASPEVRLSEEANQQRTWGLSQ